jgi:hypothetical protein
VRMLEAYLPMLERLRVIARENKVCSDRKGSPGFLQ